MPVTSSASAITRFRAGVVAIAATYVFFLLYAQFGLVFLIQSRGGGSGDIQQAMMVMGVVGLGVVMLLEQHPLPSGRPRIAAPSGGADDYATEPTFFYWPQAVIEGRAGHRVDPIHGDAGAQPCSRRGVAGRRRNAVTQSIRHLGSHRR